MSNLEKEMIPVPIPTEVPEPPSLDQIPLDILHSATVELLIQQNEDLSSRLKVNIRRNSQLELGQLKRDKDIKDLNQKVENLSAQIEITKEKEKIWQEKIKKNDQLIKTLKTESEMMELRYNELHTTTRQKIKEQQQNIANKFQENEQLNKKLMISKRVRLRAKERLRSFLIEVGNGLFSNEKSIKKSESSNKILKKNFALLKDEITEKESFFKEQLHNFKQISQKQIFELDHKLNAALEKAKVLREEKEDLQNNIAQLNVEFHEEKKNRNKIAALTEQIQELKNERLRTEHQASQQENQWKEACESERSKNKVLLKELNQHKSSSESLKKTLSTCEDKMLNLSKDNKEISMQLSTIQKLWMDAQDKLEKLELRCESLEKINRELSQNKKVDQLSRIQEQTSSTIEETNKTESTAKENQEINKDLQNKIKEAFAGQYSNFNRQADL